MKKKKQLGGKTMSYWYSHMPGDMMSPELTNMSNTGLLTTGSSQVVGNTELNRPIKCSLVI